MIEQLWVKDHLAEGLIMGDYLYELYIMDIVVNVMQIDTYEILRYNSHKYKWS